ncbi:MAG: hypothetical protein WB663_01850 [Beijerinckiaceae bacterium]|jgi:hypothetical protein
MGLLTERLLIALSDRGSETCKHQCSIGNVLRDDVTHEIVASELLEIAERARVERLGRELRQFPCGCGARFRVRRVGAATGPRDELPD